ncbi:unnamed protein product [Acanthosepion pharaonis]|uniref:Uncharacterized protein n=1 Tax=Acanthosepion pharaonis TaxID=158019 RepID=A0A812CBC8_ACAPH|nr:unnamed protein product [Sepia pharaonis]
MSICIIRCKDRRNATHRDGVNVPCKCVTEHGNYTCPSQQSTYWPDVPVGQSTDPESSGSYSKRSRRGLYPGGELGNGQKCADGDYQEIGGMPCGRDNEHKQFMNPDCHSEREDGWSEGDSRHSREGPDLNTSQHFKSPSSMTDQNPRKNIQKKSKQLTHFYHGDTNNSSSRSLHKPNIGHIPDCTAVTAGLHARTHLTTDSREFNSTGILVNSSPS